MKYVFSVAKINKVDLIVESNESHIVTRHMLEDKISSNQFDLDSVKDKIHSYVELADITETYKQNLSEVNFDKLNPDISFIVDDKNTVRARQYAQSICELFECILDKHDITIPDPDLNSLDEDGAARIYGETYFNLEDQITDIITDLVNGVKKDEIQVISDTY